MGGGFGPTVALSLLHLHCEREGGRGEGVQSVFVLFASLILCKYSCYNETPLYAKRYYFSCARIGGTKKRQILSHKTSSVLDILEHDYIEHTIKAPPPPPPPPLSLSLSLSLSDLQESSGGR